MCAAQLLHAAQPVTIDRNGRSRSPEYAAELQNTLLENPGAGDVIPGGAGLRKLRVALPGRGKRGDARVIYYHWVSKEQCYLVYAYAKNVTANLSPDQLRRLAQAMQAVIKTENRNE